MGDQRLFDGRTYIEKTVEDDGFLGVLGSLKTIERPKRPLTFAVTPLDTLPL